MKDNGYILKGIPLMDGIFGSALSGLKAFQAAINLTSHNISNANTKGYSLREVEFSQSSLQLFGNGVEISGIKRVVNQVAIDNVRSSTAAFHKSDSFYTRASNLEAFSDNDSTNLSKTATQLFDSLQKVNATPTSIPSRTLFMNQMSLLNNRIRAFSDRFAQENSTVNQELSQTASQVTQIAKQIADINEKITKTTPEAGLSLQDQRDQLLEQLSEKISYRTYSHTDGSLDILIGPGNPLVVGNTANKMQVVANAENPEKLDLAMLISGNLVNVSQDITSGSAAGLIEYRDNLLEPMSQQIGRFSLALRQEMNQQNKLGMDLNGNLGDNLLSDVNTASLQSARVLPNQNNLGTSSMAVQIDDASQLTLSNYRLIFTSPTNYDLVRLSDNSSVTSGAIAGFPSTISADGFSIQITGGSFNAADTYLIAPMRNASAELSMLTTDPTKLAIASPVAVSNSNQNIGSGAIKLSNINDTSNASFATTGQLSPPLSIEFLSGSSYQIRNANTNAIIEGPIAYTPGSAQQVFPTPGGYDPGYSIELSGIPATGDRFNIQYNSNGFGDNFNGLKLASLQSKAIMDNQRTTFDEDFNNFISSLAVSINSAQISQKSDRIVMDQASATRESISGVNLDEEAVKLLQYEKAYQASANAISTASRMLDALLSIAARG